MEINNIKRDFPLLENENITYLDSGATTQKPIQVINAVEEFYQRYNANPHRGAYSLSVEATEQYENTRTKIAKFINAKHREEIIFSKNATESLNLIAYSYGLDNLKKDDEVVISIMEHHSNLVPWQKVSKVTGAKLKYMYINNEFELTDEEMIEHYTNLVKKHGEKLTAKWVYGMVIYNGKEVKEYTWSKSNFYFVDKPCEKRNPGYPLDSISIVPEFNKYLVELTEEEKIKNNSKNSDDGVIKFIVDNIN